MGVIPTGYSHNIFQYLEEIPAPEIFLAILRAVRGARSVVDCHKSCIVTMLQCYNYNCIMLQLQCYNVTMLQCYNYNVPMFQCYNEYSISIDNYSVTIGVYNCHKGCKEFSSLQKMQFMMFVKKYDVDCH